MKMGFEEYVEALGLLPHPEGGWYREVYRSAGKYPFGDGDFPSGRNYCTAIYFMISKGNFSAFHRIKSDETWHFYAGDALEIVEITPGGILTKTIVGQDIQQGQLFQYTVKACTWFASRVANEGLFSLTGCTVAPGFDFRDFEMASGEYLIRNFPACIDIIKSLTRP